MHPSIGSGKLPCNDIGTDRIVGPACKTQRQPLTSEPPPDSHPVFHSGALPPALINSMLRHHISAELNCLCRYHDTCAHENNHESAWYSVGSAPCVRGVNGVTAVAATVDVRVHSVVNTPLGSASAQV